MKTLVIGGTGTVGTQVVAELLRRGGGARVMSRSRDRLSSLPPGVEGVTGDLQDPASLPAAFDGIDALFLATALVADEINQGMAAVEAAKAAQLKHVVYMSVHAVEEGPHIPHFVTKFPIEHAIRRSGTPYTLIRPNNFFQNDYWFRDAILNGVYPQPLGDAGCSRVDVRDIAEAIAISILEPGHAGKTYSLVGPEPMTGASVAQEWTRALGRPVVYAGHTDMDAWQAQTATYLPAWLALDLRIMYEHFQERGLIATAEEIDTQTRLLGHAPRRFADFAAETAAQWKSAGAGASS